MDDIQDYLHEATQLFARMDNAYETVAKRLGFDCRGCEDNCCRSLFYHHTLVEYFHLRRGLSSLPDMGQTQIRRRAARVVTRQTEVEGRTGLTADDARRPMCPLNIEGRCGLYDHRPMICRLHGIPHELHRPGGPVFFGPGCDTFYRQGSDENPDAVRLDRTPWYSALSQLERRLRNRIGYSAKMKMTIAQMILKEPRGLEIPV